MLVFASYDIRKTNKSFNEVINQINLKEVTKMLKVLKVVAKGLAVGFTAIAYFVSACLAIGFVQAVSTDMKENNMTFREVMKSYLE